jgi:hypothetical protein
LAAFHSSLRRGSFKFAAWFIRVLAVFHPGFSHVPQGPSSGFQCRFEPLTKVNLSFKWAGLLRTHLKFTSTHLNPPRSTQSARNIKLAHRVGEFGWENMITRRITSTVPHSRPTCRTYKGTRTCRSSTFKRGTIPTLSPVVQTESQIKSNM